MSSLVILAASVFKVLCGKKQTDRQTTVKTLPPQLPSAWVHLRETDGTSEEHNDKMAFYKIWSFTCTKKMHRKVGEKRAYGKPSINNKMVRIGGCVCAHGFCNYQYAQDIG